MTTRKDGKVCVSFRIPQEIEKDFHTYWASRTDRISKSDLFAEAIKTLIEEKTKEELNSVFE